MESGWRVRIQVDSLPDGVVRRGRRLVVQSANPLCNDSRDGRLTDTVETFDANEWLCRHKTIVRSERGPDGFRLFSLLACFSIVGPGRAPVRESRPRRSIPGRTPDYDLRCE